MSQKTLDAFLSRDIPNTIAANLITKKQTLVSLNRLSDVGLQAFGLAPEHIAAIRDTKRPAIPAKILRQVMDESWRTCCICHRPGRPIVVHHIIEWAKGGTHDESNLAVLCLDDHHNAHLTGGLATMLTAAAVVAAKKQWIARAKKLRESYQKQIINPHRRGVRWYWIHFANLRARLASLPVISVGLEAGFVNNLKAKAFIGSNGHIQPESQWIEQLDKPKSFLFDSGDAQSMAIYVSSLLCDFAANAPVVDITDMLAEKVALRNYLSVGSFVYFRHELEINEGASLVTATINKTDVRIEFAFDPWTSLNQTAKGIHVVADMAERSVVAEVSAIKLVGQQLRIQLSPLGISPDFILHDQVQGDWVEGADNTDYRRRRKKAGE